MQRGIRGGAKPDVIDLTRERGNGGNGGNGGNASWIDLTRERDDEVNDTSHPLIDLTGDDDTDGLPLRAPAKKARIDGTAAVEIGNDEKSRGRAVSVTRVDDDDDDDEGGVEEAKADTAAPAAAVPLAVRTPSRGGAGRPVDYLRTDSEMRDEPMDPDERAAIDALRDMVAKVQRQRHRTRNIPRDRQLEARLREDLKFENKLIEEASLTYGKRPRRSGNTLEGSQSLPLPLPAPYDPRQVAHPEQAEGENGRGSIQFDGDDYNAWSAQKTWLTRSEASTAGAVATRLQAENPKRGNAANASVRPPGKT